MTCVQIAAAKRAAERMSIPYQTLLRMWIAERLAKERVGSNVPLSAQRSAQTGSVSSDLRSEVSWWVSRREPGAVCQVVRHIGERNEPTSGRLMSPREL